MSARSLRAWLACSLLLLTAGAARPADEPASAPPEVAVMPPVSREVADHENFIGRTEAAITVDLRARVTGYLDKVGFKDGSDVKQGDVLFEIDPRPYQAELARADASLTLAEAHLKRAETDFERAKTLLGRGSISREDHDKIAGDRAEAQAAISIARAGRDAARLTLSFTKVAAPVSGRVGRRLVDPGNIVKADDTILATIITQDPIYAYFDVDERTLLRLRRAALEKPRAPEALPVTVGLADETGFPHQARLDFVGGQVDPSTGTVRMRAVLPNANGLLVPGLVVRVRLTTGEPYKALLVPERAVATDGARKFVYVVNDKNVVESRPLTLGSLHEGLRVVKDGLNPGDRVVVGGPRGLRAGMTVKPVKAPESAPPQERPEKPDRGGR
jgi:RND family efflux transporter MFP subunit